MTDQITVSIFLKPFAIGLYIGILLTIIIFIREKVMQKRLKNEIKDLKRHIQIKLEIEAENNERRKREIEELKKQNENLRITLQKYIEKPDRKELRQLNIYQRAVEILTVKAPGFAQSWQSAVSEAEEEVKKSESGIIPFVRKLIPIKKKNTKTGNLEKTNHNNI